MRKLLALLFALSFSAGVCPAQQGRASGNKAAKRERARQEKLPRPLALDDLSARPEAPAAPQAKEFQDGVYRPTVTQTTNNSPGGVQAAGDVVHGAAATPPSKWARITPDHAKALELLGREAQLAALPAEVARLRARVAFLEALVSALGLDPERLEVKAAEDGSLVVTPKQPPAPPASHTKKED